MSANVFSLTQKADGFHFLSAEGVSREKRKKLLGTVYPTAEAAEFAATGDTFTGGAEGDITAQHAVGICTHADNVISFGGGSRRHRTNFRYHRNGRHYTTTYHEIWRVPGGWRVIDKFKYSVSRKFCGCN